MFLTPRHRERHVSEETGADQAFVEALLDAAGTFSAVLHKQELGPGEVEGV